MANRVLRGKNGNLLPDCKNVTEPYLGRGGGGERRDHVEFIVTQPKSVSSDPSFRPWHLKHSHPVGKKISLCWEV